MTQNARNKLRIQSWHKLNLSTNNLRMGRLRKERSQKRTRYAGFRKPADSQVGRLSSKICTQRDSGGVGVKLGKTASGFGKQTSLGAVYRCFGGTLSEWKRGSVFFVPDILLCWSTAVGGDGEEGARGSNLQKYSKYLSYLQMSKRAVKSLNVYQIKGREEKGRTFVAPDKDRVLRAQRARLFPRQDFWSRLYLDFD